MRKLVAAFAAVTALAAVGVGSALAAEPVQKGHVLSNPLAEKQNALREAAQGLMLEGKIPTGSKVGKVANGQYVKLAQEGEGRIFAMLVEFGNQKDAVWGGPDGPLHGALVPPIRANDNTTIWFDNYEPGHYYDLYFNRNPAAKSVANFYAEQSSGRYSFTGGVSNWVKVPFNEGRYGTNDCNRDGDTNDPEDSNVCGTVQTLVSHAAATWVADQIAAGKSMAEIKAYLSTFDVEDRYDADGDGNFNEADGYIDHFQLNHAGADEAVGGGAEGEYAIWSHRSYAFQNGIGVNGPPNALLGGVQIGVSGSLGLNNPTGIWIGDYLMNPENGGVGVIAHETGHDYGLPDHYDQTYTGESSSAFWTLMSSGSYGGDNTNGIGNWPVGFSAWDKFQLGWLNYEVARAGEKSEHKLGPLAANSKQAQGVFVVLPKKAVTVNLGAPFAGSKYYYSGAGDNLDNSMTKAVNLPAGSTLTAKVRYAIELDWDYAYVVVSADNGAHWTSVPTNLSTSTNPNSQNFGHGITGSSGGNWVDLTADLGAFTGNVLVGFRYWTDGAAVEPGFSADNVSIAGGAVDGAEADAGWTFKGFRATTGSETQQYSNYYVVENRQYMLSEDSLRTGPYNFGFLNTRPDWVEHFPYQDGVLVSYWDTSQHNNQVGVHPGEGLILPIDAHQNLVTLPNGTPARTRIQVYDATLSTTPTDALTLHVNGVPYTKASEAGIATFDDSQSYWSPAKPDTGVKVPNTGTTIRLQSISSAGFAQVQVAPK